MWSFRSCRFRRKRLLALFLILPSIGTMCMLLYMIELPDISKNKETDKPPIQLYGGPGGKGQRQLLVPNKHHERRPKSHTALSKPQRNRKSVKTNNKPEFYNNNRPIYKMQDRKIHGQVKTNNWNDIPDEYRVNEYDGYDDERDHENKNTNTDDKTKDFYNDGHEEDVDSIIIEDNDEDDDEEYDYALYNPAFRNEDFDKDNNSNSSLPVKADSYNAQFDEHSNNKDNDLYKESRSLKGHSDNVKPISRQLKNSITRTGAESHIDKRILPWTLPPNVENGNNSPSSHFISKDNLLHDREPATQIQMPLLWKAHRNEVRNYAGLPIVVDKIFWSSQVEDYVPKGITNHEATATMHQMRDGHAKLVSPPSWDRCGHNKNRFITLDDGISMCARYRDPHIKLVFGELLSFHLARYLGLDNIPVVVLSWTNSSAPMWRNHQIEETGWDEGKVLALIQWINNLNTPRSRVHLPPVILDAYSNNSTLAWKTPELQRVPVYDLTDLLQWSDLILFDYITGHYDRLASMQDGSEKERDPSILEGKIRNLQRAVKSGKMWLIDNESGLFDAFELLYMGKEMGLDFINYHKKMLKSICIFRKDLVDRIRTLASNPFPDDVLYQYAWEREPILSQIMKPPQYYLFAKYFKKRLLEVLEWINICKTR